MPSPARCALGDANRVAKAEFAGPNSRTSFGFPSIVHLCVCVSSLLGSVALARSKSNSPGCSVNSKIVSCRTFPVISDGIAARKSCGWEGIVKRSGKAKVEGSRQTPRLGPTKGNGEILRVFIYFCDKNREFSLRLFIAQKAVSTPLLSSPSTGRRSWSRAPFFKRKSST
jgi:hypothetical protein